jgi:hypothetical protein
MKPQQIVQPPERPRQFIVCQAPGIDLDMMAAIVAAIAEATEAADLLQQRQERLFAEVQARKAGQP